jgi:hypothetical protein
VTTETARKLVNVLTIFTTKTQGGKRIVKVRVQNSGFFDSLIYDVGNGVTDVDNNRVKLLVIICGYFGALTQDASVLYLNRIRELRYVTESSLSVVEALARNGALKENFIKAVRDVWNNSERDKNSPHYKQVLVPIFKKYLTIDNFPQFKTILEYGTH